MTLAEEKLLEKASESIRGADILLHEGLYGFAISRAYYAMFYVAQAFLLTKDLSYSKHAGVIAGFGQHFAKTGLVPRKFHEYLIEAQRERLIGDYDPDVEFTEAKAKQQLERAETFLELARELLPKMVQD